MRLGPLGRIVVYGVLAVVAVLTLLPLWTGITTALKTSQEVILSTPVAPPLHPTLKPLIEALDYIGRSLLNSLVLVVSGVMTSCFLGSLLGYVFAKQRFPGSGTLFLLVVFCLYVPPQVQLIPMVRITSIVGLHGNLAALVLLYMVFGTPMSTFIFKMFYEDIPDSFIEAAKLDGAGVWLILRRVMLPVSAIPFIVAALLQVTIIWNDFIWGLVLTSGKDNFPVTVSLANLKGSFVAEWNLQMAGALWVALPTLLIFIFLCKYIIRGYSAQQ